MIGIAPCTFVHFHNSIPGEGISQQGINEYFAFLSFCQLCKEQKKSVNPFGLAVNKKFWLNKKYWQKLLAK